MKTKEEILKEFDEKILRVCDVYEQAADNSFDKLAIWEKERVDIKEFISDLIAQTREETIREVEEMVEKEFPHQKLYCEAQDLRTEILEELNKLKK